jgi:hypothetical protein
MFTITPLIKIALITGAIVALIGGYAYWDHRVYTRGYNAAIADVAAKNKGAIANVRKATKNVRDCYERDGAWDAARGLCE